MSCIAIGDMAAPISSGSFPTIGMIVAPCSVRSMAEIATGVTTTLLTRAADVVLKERRRLVLMVRETPLHTGHLRTMTALSEMGAVIAPPVPAFYAKPQSLDEMIDQTLGRMLDLFGLDAGTVRRWGEEPGAGRATLRAKRGRSDARRSQNRRALRAASRPRPDRSAPRSSARLAAAAARAVVRRAARPAANSRPADTAPAARRPAPARRRAAAAPG